jgi:hypothetical protein
MTPIETARERGHPTLVAALEKAAAAKK